MTDRRNSELERQSKDSRTTLTQRHRRVAGLRPTSLGMVPALPEDIGWNYNAVLTGLTFRCRAGIWTAIIKADFGNSPMVAFLDVGTFPRTVEVLCEYAQRRALTWLPDKYPPRR